MYMVLNFECMTCKYITDETDRIYGMTHNTLDQGAYSSQGRREMDEYMEVLMWRMFAISTRGTKSITSPN